MGFLMDVAYGGAALVAAPVMAIKSWRTGKYRSDWAGRMGQGEMLWRRRGAGERVIMLHCVSVGELLSVRHLIERLLVADPRVKVLITTTTDTGTARARELYPANPKHPKHNPRVAAERYPLDFSFAVEAFFERTRPDVVALVELETWPNFLQVAASRRIPVAVINGRMTERSFKKYRLVRPVVRRMFARVSWFGVQTGTIAERFAALGGSAICRRMEIVASLKYDVAEITDRVAGSDTLAAACGVSRDHALIVGGSTGPGEETALLATYLAVRGRFPELRLAIAPRHPEVVAQVIAAIRAAGLTPVLRTQCPDGTQRGPLGREEVLLLNTLGELKKLYSLAWGAFVGRSLVPLGGSDMIEVAALGKPCCFGPHTVNFAEAVELLLDRHGAVVVADGEALTDVVRGWLADPVAAAAMGRAGRAAIVSKCGSTERYVKKLLELAGVATAETVP